VSAPARAGAPGGRTLAVAWALVRRNLVAIGRLPSALVPSLVFPVFGTIAFASVYGAAIRQYYPDLPRLNWYVPLNVLQGAAFGSVFLAFGAIRDFQTGIFDRLLAAPTRRSAILVGFVLTAMVRSLLPLVLVVAIGAAGGMSLPGGALSLLLLLLATLMVAVIGVCWGVGLAFRFKSMAAAPLMQVGVFVLVFLSESQVPEAGLSGWLKWVSAVNPATQVLRLGRQGFLHEITWAETWPGIVAFLGLFALTAGFAARGLRKLVP
jgi:ABC-2 type transport system permease protein